MISLPGIQAVGRFSTDALALRVRHGRLNRGGDILGDLVLYGKYVGEIAVVSFSPKMSAGRGLNELSGDPDAASRLPHATFKYKANAELASDLFDIDGSTFIRKTRIARDDKQPA